MCNCRQGGWWRQCRRAYMSGMRDTAPPPQSLLCRRACVVLATDSSPCSTSLCARRSRGRGRSHSRGGRGQQQQQQQGIPGDIRRTSSTRNTSIHQYTPGHTRNARHARNARDTRKARHTRACQGTPGHTRALIANYYHIHYQVLEMIPSRHQNSPVYITWPHARCLTTT